MDSSGEHRGEGRTKKLQDMKSGHKYSSYGSK